MTALKTSVSFSFLIMKSQTNILLVRIEEV